MIRDRKRLERMAGDLLWCRDELGDQLTGHQRGDLEKAWSAVMRLLERYKR